MFFKSIYVPQGQSKIHFPPKYGSTGCGVFKRGMRYTKLERFLHKNQYTQRKLLNFENWTNGEP